MKIDLFLGIVGLPRSGTTLLTALLDAHPRIELYYEPWNASPKQRPAVPRDLAAFLDAMVRRFGIVPGGATHITGFKETSISAASRDWAIATLDRLAPRIETLALWIYRDPIHCLLSKLEGARRWWGQPDARMTREVLEQSLRESADSIAVFRSLAKRVPTALVQYDSLVAEPAAALADVMEALGERLDPTQLEYYRAGPQPQRVMGDVGVARDPRPVSASAAQRRAMEAQAHAALVGEVIEAPGFAWLREQCHELASLPAVSPLS